MLKERQAGEDSSAYPAWGRIRFDSGRRRASVCASRLIAPKMSKAWTISHVRCGKRLARCAFKILMYVYYVYNVYAHI